MAWHCGDLMDFYAISQGLHDPHMAQDGGLPEIQEAVLKMVVLEGSALQLRGGA